MTTEGQLQSIQVSLEIFCLFLLHLQEVPLQLVQTYTTKTFTVFLASLQMVHNILDVLVRPFYNGLKELVLEPLEGEVLHIGELF